MCLFFLYFSFTFLAPYPTPAANSKLKPPSIGTSSTSSPKPGCAVLKQVAKSL